MRGLSLLVVAVGLGCTFDTGSSQAESGQLVETDSEAVGSSTTSTPMPVSSSGSTAPAGTTGTTEPGPTTSADVNDSDEAMAFVQELVVTGAGRYDLAEVPLLVTLTPDNSQWDAIEPDLSNLRFTGSIDGDDIELPFEVGAAGDQRVQLWVLVPEVSNAADRFRVEYGVGVSPAAWAPGDVWTHYEAVWHLDEDPSDPEPQYLDSSGNGRGITNPDNDSIPSEDMVPGIVGRAPRFGEGREMQISNFEWDSNIGERFTLEAWVQYEVLPPLAYRTIVRKAEAYELVGSRNNQPEPLGRPAWSVYDGTQFHNTTASTESWADGAGVWNYAAATFERNPNADAVRTALYIDGLGVAIEQSDDYEPAQNQADFRIGSNLSAVVDEVRVSFEVRPPQWFELQNLSTRDELLEYGEAIPLK